MPAPYPGSDVSEKVTERGTTGVRGHPDPNTFVGRRRELAELRVGLEAAVAGQGGLFLVSGEPGIGKTRLAQQIAAEAESQGAIVLWGRCWEGGGAHPYWPWVQLLRSYAGQCERKQLVRDLGDGADLVGRLAPEILGHRRRKVRDLGAARGSLDARFALFDAVTEFWKRVAAARPCLFIFDDLHTADRSSLLLLQFLALQLTDTGILIVGTHREREVRASQAREVFADLDRRSAGLRLEGLSMRETGELLNAMAGAAPVRDRASEFYRATGGNPYFIRELARAMADGGQGAVRELPPRVREAVARRLAQLPRSTRDVLELAAVVGVEFDLATLMQTRARGAKMARASLGEALADGLVVRRVPRGERYQFTHALIREVLYDRVPPARLSRLHLQVGRAIERQRTRDAGARLSILAHHFRHAQSAGGAAKAIDYFLKAGERAFTLFAFDEAVSHFKSGLECLDAYGGDERARCQLLLGLGNAHRAHGASAASYAAFDEAADSARHQGAPDLLGRAAVEPAPWRTPGAPDERRLDLLKDALRPVGRRRGSLRVRLLACLGRELCWSEPARAVELTREAVELGRRVGDADALAYALDCRCGILERPALADERFATACEMLTLATDTHDKASALEASRWRLAEFVARGDVSAVDREIGRQASLSAALRQPDYRWRVLLSRVMRELLRGNFPDADALIQEAARFEGPTAAAALYGQMFVLMRDQGRHDELAPLMEVFAASQAEMGGERAIHSGLAVLYAELGQEAEARRQFELLAHDDFADLPSFSHQMVLACLADTAVLLDDRPRSAKLYDLLAPFRGRNLTLAPVLACLGPADRLLGLLALTLGRHDEARAHIAAALAMCRRLASRPLLARAQHASALVLARAGDRPSRREARRLAQAAEGTAKALGMRRLTEAAGALVEASNDWEEGAGVPAATPHERSVPRSMLEGLLRREGDVWRIGYDGTECSLKHSTGMSHLAELLAQPGRSFHALELTAAQAGPPRTAASGVRDRLDEGLRTTRLGEGRAHIDSRTRALYAARLVDLRRELDEAESAGDSARLSRAREEMAILAREVGGVVGVGRFRGEGTPAERARVNVGKAIRRALTRIARHHATLGTHLDRSIRTGTFCAYEPDPRVPMHWTIER